MPHRTHHQQTVPARPYIAPITASAAAAAVCAVVLALTAGPASGGKSDEEQQGGSLVEATFSQPPKGGTDTDLTDHLRDLIKRAPSDASIKIALHSLSGREFKDELVAAQTRAVLADPQKRRVAVEVIYDGTKMGTVPKALQRDLVAAGGRFVECTHSRDAGACISPRKGYSRMHAKYALISKTEKQPGEPVRNNVVWIGSANITKATGWGAHNDAITVYDDPGLYKGMEKLFDRAADQDRRFFKPADIISDSTAHVSVFPSPVKGGDVVLRQLGEITPNPDTSEPGCELRVMQAQFKGGKGGRGVRIAKRLATLSRKGCETSVLVNSKGGAAEIGAKAKATLCGGGVEVRKHRKIHDKAFVVDAGGKKVVFTGSHNLTKRALRNNDEVFARVPSSGPVYDGFKGHFQSAYGKAQKVCSDRSPS